MKLRILPSLFSLFLVFSMLSTLTTCAEREETVSCFPRSNIGITVNLNEPLYYSNIFNNQWTYVDATQGGAGTRGLIIYHRGNYIFDIYDRNAPHLCPDENTTLDVITDTDGFLKIKCQKDGSKWILALYGQPDKSSKTQIWPKKYSYTFDKISNILYIHN